MLDPQGVGGRCPTSRTTRASSRSAARPLAQEPEHLAGVDVAIVGAPTDDLVSDRPGHAVRAARDPRPRRARPARTSRRVSTRSPSCRIVDYGDAPVLPADPERIARGDRAHRRRGRRRGRAAGHARRRPLDHGAVHRGDRRAARAGRADPLRHAHRHGPRGLRRRALARDADVPPRRGGSRRRAAVRADRAARVLAGAGRVRVAARARDRELLHARRARRSAFARSSSARSRTWGRGRST